MMKMMVFFPREFSFIVHIKLHAFDNIKVRCRQLEVPQSGCGVITSYMCGQGDSSPQKVLITVELVCLQVLGFSLIT